MNTANKLTMLRVALIPVFLILLYLRFPFHMYFALTVFILASVTDFVDGYIARHYNQVTDFGKFMDPLADKVLVMAALLWFVEAGRLPAWVLLVVIVREFAVTALRLIAVERGRVIAAAWSGKVSGCRQPGPTTAFSDSPPSLTRASASMPRSTRPF